MAALERVLYRYRLHPQRPLQLFCRSGAFPLRSPSHSRPNFSSQSQRRSLNLGWCSQRWQGATRPLKHSTKPPTALHLSTRAMDAAPTSTSSSSLLPTPRRTVAARGHALKLKQLEDLPQLPQQPAARARAAPAGAGFRPSPQAPVVELLGLGIAAQDGKSLLGSPTHHRTASQDDTDPDSSASSLALLVDAFPPPPSFTPWPNSPPLSSPAQECRFLPSPTSPRTQRGRNIYLSPALSIAEPVSPDYSPAAPPKIPLPVSCFDLTASDCTDV